MTPTFRALIFDMDGTLTKPVLDFKRMREEIGLPDGGDLAHIIKQLPEREQLRAWSIVERHEEEALEHTLLQPGCLALLGRCANAGLLLGLVTRNTQRSVDHFCELHNVSFDGVVTREFPHMKPHPEPIRHLLTQWKAAPQDTLMIGDYVHDIQCGIEAGTHTCFFQNPGKPFYGSDADFTVSSMAELERIVFEAPTG